MGSIIIALPRSDKSEKIAGAIRRRGMTYDINICDNGSQVIRVTNSRDYGVVICTKSLCDMGYIELAEMLPETFSTIILTSDMTIETVREDMVKLMLPLQSSDLFDTIEMLFANYEHRPRKRDKKPPKRSAEEQKLLDEAKALLMERNGLTEPEAFRYIQKNSMDYGRKLVESAEMILLMYNRI